MKLPKPIKETVLIWNGRSWKLPKPKNEKQETIDHVVTIIGIKATEHTDKNGNTWFTKSNYKEACDYLRDYILSLKKLWKHRQYMCKTCAVCL